MNMNTFSSHLLTKTYMRIVNRDTPALYLSRGYFLVKPKRGRPPCYNFKYHIIITHYRVTRRHNTLLYILNTHEILCDGVANILIKCNKINTSQSTLCYRLLVFLLFFFSFTSHTQIY